MMGLPTSLVKRRKQKLSVYFTQQYFEFVCFVESVYLANLSLKMMLACEDGNIISIIKTSILSNNGARERFDALSLSNVVECEHQCVLAYIIERYYANMRGRFFDRHLKCNSRNNVQKLAKSQATRTNVSQAVYCAKVNDNGVFERDSTPEDKDKELWESTKDCYFELADKDNEDSIDK